MELFQLLFKYVTSINCRDNKIQRKMESKIDRTDLEGNFATPDIFARDGVTSRMDAKFPFHPLEKSEAK